MKTCGRCGFENFDEAFLCRKCGTKLKKVKNKSLDLDVQNRAANSSAYQQQAYQRQSYDPYEQQRYQQQQYQPNQTYQQGFYGEQNQQNDYQQQYQSQAQNDDNSYYDNSYANNYQNQQADFTNQNFYGNDTYNNYTNDSFNNFNNEFNNYNNDYNGTADNSNDYNNSFNGTDNNQQQEQYNNPQQPDGNNVGNNQPQYTYTESHNGNTHTFTATSRRAIPIDEIPLSEMSQSTRDELKQMFNKFDSQGEPGKIFIKGNPKTVATFMKMDGNNMTSSIGDEFKQIFDAFKNQAQQQHGQINMNSNPQSMSDYLQREYERSMNPVQRHKPKTAPLVAIIAIIVVFTTALTIGAAMWYAESTNRSTHTNSSSTSTESTTEATLPTLTMDDKIYTLVAKDNNSISVECQLPEKYAIVTESSSDSNIQFEKSITDLKNNDTEKHVRAFISIINTNANETIETIRNEYKDLPEIGYTENVVSTPIGDMTTISIIGDNWGYIPLDENHCLQIFTMNSDENYNLEAKAVLEQVANSCKKI